MSYERVAIRGKQVNYKGDPSSTNIRIKKGVFLRSLPWLIVVFAISFVPLQQFCGAESNTWEKKVSEIVWVAYAPTTANPNQAIEPTVESLKEDLLVLRKAGFTGLVTYGCSGVLGQKLPELAQKEKFQGLILGIWDPTNQKEIAAAIAVSGNPIVLGYCVGNEGLEKRYELEQLSTVMQSLRTLTGKAVTTTEELKDYSDRTLLDLGDWVFPNVHPYFHRKLDPTLAIEWTVAAYQDLKRRSKRFILFKEVGLPTAGDLQKRLTESSQEQYYRGLAQTNVKFVYFEAFDQLWKTHLPVEPHWGIFCADRTPKSLARHLIEKHSASQGDSDSAFHVYLDAGSREKNHFAPSGYMGDCGDIHIKEDFKENPHSGESCIRVVYMAKGKGPYTCDYGPPCKWAGVYWQQPPDNWGTNPKWKGKGFNLSPYKRLTFWARADKDCRIEFKVGGIKERYGDSLKYPRTKTAKLTENWQTFEIDLKGADLKHIIGGFCWVTNWNSNSKGATFYLDDIRFEKK